MFCEKKKKIEITTLDKLLIILIILRLLSVSLLIMQERK